MKSKIPYNLTVGALAGVGNFMMSSSVSSALLVGVAVAAFCFAYYRFTGK